MSVAFTAPSNIGGGAITSYTVIASNGQTASGATSPITVSGLSAATSYTFIAYANNVYGPSPASATSASASTYKVPGAPTNASATAGSQQASVSFTAPSDLGIPASITGYRVTSSPGGFTATGASSPITVTGLTNGTAYTFTVEAQNAAGYGPASSASNSVTPFTETPLYPFTSYTFTKAGASLRNGPTLGQCQTAYSGTAFIGSYFAVPVQGVQQLTIPSTGTYRITAAGAKGGNLGQLSATQGDATNAGGSGRIMVATVTLNKGDIVYILVGQQGQGYTSTGQGSGGGGGTFLSRGASWTASTLLVAAGGGGGSSGGSGGTVSNQNGQTGTSGGGWGGGTNGNGGTESLSSTEQGAPGGGWLSSGLVGSSYPGAQIRSSSTATGAQSVYGDAANTGGFGGGASGWGASGGGGGYSGGGAQSTASNTGSRISAGGGGSYVDGTLVSNSGLNYGDGYLTLEKL
jgi:hypothetical protein